MGQMWRLASVKRYQWSVDVLVYDATGIKSKRHDSDQRKEENKQAELWSFYNQAITDLLKGGWEPFSTEDRYEAIWFRMKVEE